MKTWFKINKKLRFTLLSVGFLVCLFAVGAGGLIWGLNLHNNKSNLIYEGKKSISEFLCFGLDNTEETYQLDCYNPKPDQTFKMSSTLNCTSTTMQTLRSDDYSENTKKYLITTVSKTNDIHFQITIDANGKMLSRSNTGEDAKGKFDIVKNDNSAIVAIRKAPVSVTGYEYEQITILKKSGKGSRIWYESIDSSPPSDAISTDLIQCKSS